MESESRGLMDMGIEYIIQFGKRKHIYLCIRQGQLIVRVPKGTKKSIIEQVVKKKESWILKHLGESAGNVPKECSYENNSIFPLLGRDYRLSVEYKMNIHKIQISRETEFQSPINEVLPLFLEIYVPNNYDLNCLPEKLKKVVEQYYKKLAIKIIEERVDRFSKLTGLYPKSVAVRKMKRSWGRCTDRGNISFNTDIIKRDIEFIDYVVLHELCHLKYMNHSKSFWSLVECYMPNYKSLRN